MNFRTSFWYRSIFLKVILVFVLVITPFYVLGLLLNDRGYSSVYSEISKSMESRLHFYANLLKLEFDKIILFQHEFVNDSDLIELSGKSEIMSDPEKTYAMIRFQKRLLQLKYSSSYIHDVIAYIPSLTYAVSANNLYNAMPAEEFTALQQLKTQSVSPFVNWHGRLFIVMPSPGWTHLDHKPPIYLITVEIDSGMLRNALNTFTIDYSGGGVLAGNDNRWMIYNTDDMELLNRLVDGSKLDSVRRSFPLLVSKKKYIVMQERVPALGVTLIMYIPETQIIGQLKQYKVWYWILSLLSIITILLFAYWIFRIVHRPLRKLIKAFRKLEVGDLNVVVQHKTIDEFHYIYEQFNWTIRKLSVLIEEVYEEKYRRQLSELRQLQSQINPHFLYNSFFSMQAMARLGDLKSIEKYTKFLGEYFQYVTHNSDNHVTLSDEVKHVNVYTEIQSMRFRNRIETFIEPLPEAYAQLHVPRLILQPIVENAFKHGLEHKMFDGRLQIGFHADSFVLRIFVEDNGNGISDGKLEELHMLMNASKMNTEITGLPNVHRRLKIRYGDAGGLNLTRGQNGGLRVEIIIPLSGEE